MRIKPDTNRSGKSKDADRPSNGSTRAHAPSRVVRDPAPSKSLLDALRASKERDKRRSWWQVIVDKQ